MPPKTAETSPQPQNLSAEERTELVSAISEHTNQLSASYKDVANWGEARPYMGLIGMAGFLESPVLDGRRLDHVRKIIAFEYLSLVQPEDKPRNTAAFLKEVRAQAKAEITQARKFKGEVDEMPDAYREAFDDWDQIRNSLTTDRLMLALRQSMRAIRQNR